jgi:hypothetical protein
VTGREADQLLLEAAAFAFLGKVAVAAKHRSAGLAGEPGGRRDPRLRVAHGQVRRRWQAHQEAGLVQPLDIDARRGGQRLRSHPEYSIHQRPTPQSPRRR